MKCRLFMPLAVTVTMLAFSGLAMAQSAVVTLKSHHNFNETVSTLKSAISQDGLMVMGNLNQGHVLSMTGLHLQGEAFFVGNPNMGEKLFSADQAVGLFVPVRIFVYRKHGGTYVSYEKPSAEFGPLNNPKVSMMAKNLDMVLHSVAQSATR